MEEIELGSAAREAVRAVEGRTEVEGEVEEGEIVGGDAGVTKDAAREDAASARPVAAAVADGAGQITAAATAGGPDDLTVLPSGLAVNLVSAVQLESDLMAKVDREWAAREVADEERRLGLVRAEIARVKSKIKSTRQAFSDAMATDLERRAAVKLAKDLSNLVEQETQIVERMKEREQGATTSGSGDRSTRAVAGETDRERRIRLGEMTPFGDVAGLARPRMAPPPRPPPPPPVPSRAADASTGGGGDDKPKIVYLDRARPTSVPIRTGRGRPRAALARAPRGRGRGRGRGPPPPESAADATDDSDASSPVDMDDDDDDQDAEDDDGDGGAPRAGPARRQAAPPERAHDRSHDMMREHYELAYSDAVEPGPDWDWMRECATGAPDDVVLEGDYRLPSYVHDRLFPYQQTAARRPGVRWLWELHGQNAGGIIGDEMGLGKSVQTVVFLGGLAYSGLISAPCIIVCPATLLWQWVHECHRWWPPFRVGVLHRSMTGAGGDVASVVRTITQAIVPVLVDADRKEGILITTYEALKIHQDRVLGKEWAYAILDEGHKIKNPDAEITLACKRLQTSHRIILSGSPIQNSLTELWSLFDFVFPGKLGTLPVFQMQFEAPIRIGNYANASNVQLHTAYRCAVILRDLIAPFLLRRLKVDVAKDLPKKTEQVLFCRLTPTQQDAYLAFVHSDEVTKILSGRRHALYGIDILRKICNHPDLVEAHRKGGDGDDQERILGPDYGDASRSGKLQVIAALLPLWHRQGHRALLFCQTRQMLDIVQRCVHRAGFRYVRMDGNMAVGARTRLIDQFNRDATIFIFLLTTKVGGLGVNLTGADRVVIFDPDWNPSTDLQARERAWRYGQTREVTIYRLMTAGTIEEKIYHRQIYKQYLTNKILKDPKQRRFFKANDLRDLFTYHGDDVGATTETGDLFAGLDVEAHAPPRKRPHPDRDQAHVEGNAVPWVHHAENDTGSRKRKGDDVDPGATHGGGRRGGNDGAVDRSSDGEADEADDDDTSILRQLFDGAGVHSALKHDAIMEADSQERQIIEHEAERVAREAVAALRASRRDRDRGSTRFEPTWTGRSGAAGAPTAPARPFFGPRQAGGPAAGGPLPSRLLLNSLRQRAVDVGSDDEGDGDGDGDGGPRGVAGGGRGGDADADLSDAIDIDGDDAGAASVRLGDDARHLIIVKLVDFLTRKRAATSEEIVAAFRHEVHGDLVPVFRQMLHEVAQTRAPASGPAAASAGPAVWELRDEFR